MYPSAYMSYPAHFPPNNDPRAREIPFHMKMDPPYHQPWPCHPVPHGCCNHGCYGGGGGPYTFPHYPPPFSGAYPAYSTPPPHYSAEQPRYDYDKNNHVPHHFSGYNHPKVETKTNEPLVPYPIMWVPPSGNSNNESQAKENDKRPRKEPEVDKKSDESLVPLFLKDSPYPIMWVPSPGNSNNDNDKKPRKEPEVVDKKTNESLVPLFLKDSPYPIMWVPPSVYMNQDSKHSHDPVSFKDTEEPINRGENGEANHLPFPIFWLPSKNTEVGKNTKDNNLDLVTQKRLPDENRRQGHDSDSDTRNKHVPKVIPVKQAGEKQEKKSLETKMESDSVEKKDNCIEKASKLPPVCLRIEPLPRKKKTSRSPSPPGEKDRSKTSQQETRFPENLNVVVTTDANKLENSGFADSRENKNVDEKKNLSEKEAALMIQSVYRGFEVRKSQPLMKLRQIGEVTKQAVEIRNRIQDMESSCSAVRIDDKWKLAIGETIMSLLLKLDTIQGLHPTVRDIRKSVAKELVGLQEKLDSLTSIKSETPGHFKDGAIEEKLEQSDNNVPLVESGSKDSHDDSGLEEGIIGEQSHKQPVDDVIQHKFDKAVTEFDSTNEDVGLDRVIFENQDSMDSNAEGARDIRTEQNTEELNSDKHVETEQRLDDSIQEESDKMEAEYGVIDKTMESVTATCEKQEAEIAESDAVAIEAGDISFEQHAESESQQSITELTNKFATPETEQTVKQEKRVETEAEFQGDKVEDNESKDVSMVEMNIGMNQSDRKLLEENDKLKLTVEELLSQQSSVIRELKRKVEDLEKKLSKKNKKTKVNKGKSRGFVVQDVI